jgi:hypothetical protein
MSEPLLTVPIGGWTVDDLDALPESHHRYELTDGALTVSPSPSSLHQAVAARLLVRLEAVAPEPLAVTQAVEIRFGRQLTRITDVLVVRSEQPGRHWFAPSEVIVAVEIESPGSHLEDRATKPALYALWDPALLAHRARSAAGQHAWHRTRRRLPDDRVESALGRCRALSRRHRDRRPAAALGRSR